MELIFKMVLKNHLEEKIDSSAEALRVRQHPFYLSLRKLILQQHRVSNYADKTAKWHISMSLRGALIATKQSPTYSEIASRLCRSQ